jgi:tRNA (mo5U34)-methyltransferase
MDYSDFRAAAAQWREQLARTKASAEPDGFTWYGYDILGNVEHIDGLLVEGQRDLLERVRGERLADIGTADGDLGYLLSSLGYDVDLIDFPATNWNGMRGVRELGKRLASTAQLHEVDLDSQFALPHQRYGLICLLGILYHLKNPYYVLEQIARHARYCLLSTRIARFAGSPPQDVSALPVAYLLRPDECNNDATNFWIFSREGLARIVERCGFRILALRTLGDTERSDPASAEHDERAFLLLESLVIQR